MLSRAVNCCNLLTSTMNQSLKTMSCVVVRVLHSRRPTIPGCLRICQIHNWVRPTLYALRGKKKRELEKNPEKAKPQPRSTFAEWNYNAEIFAFGKRLSEEFNENLLKQAFIDHSHIHKERLQREKLGIEVGEIDIKDNSELAEEGMKLLRSTLIWFVRKEYPKLPAEGVESAVNYLTSKAVLAQISSLLGSTELIKCNEYPPSEETFAKTFLAIVGALSKSSGEDRTRKFIVDFVASHLCGKDINEFWNIPKPWQMLLDLNNQLGGGSLEARILREAGKNTLLSVFVVGIYNENKKLLGTGIGETIDIAQEMAARDVLKAIFGTREPRAPFEFQSANHPIKLIPHVRNP